MTHWAAKPWLAFYLRNEQAEWDEVAAMQALDPCVVVMPIGTTDPRRSQHLDVDLVSAMDLHTVPKFMKGYEFVHAYDPKTGLPLNGGALRELQASIQRDHFNTPHDEYEAV